MKRVLTIGIACVLLGLAGFVAASAFDTHGSVAAPNQTTEGTTTTETTAPTVTTTSEPATPTPEPAETTTSGNIRPGKFFSFSPTKVRITAETAAMPPQR